MTEFLERYYSEMSGSPQAGSAGDEPMPTASPSSQTLSTAQQGASVASALFQIAAAGGRARDMQRSAGDQIVAAAAEEADALRAANEQTRQFLRASGRLRVAAADSGVDLGSASVQQLDRELANASEETRADTVRRGFSRAYARRGYARRLAANAAESCSPWQTGSSIYIRLALWVVRQGWALALP